MKFLANPAPASTEAWRASLIGPIVEMVTQAGVTLEDAMKLQSVFHTGFLGHKPPCPLKRDELWVANVVPTAFQIGIRGMDRFRGFVELPATATAPACRIRLRDSGEQHIFLIGSLVSGNDREDGPGYFYRHHLVLLETETTVGDQVDPEGCAMALGLNAVNDGTERRFEWYTGPRSRNNQWEVENPLRNLVLPDGILQDLVQVAKAADFPLPAWPKNRQSAQELASRRDNALRSLGSAPPSRVPAGVGSGPALPKDDPYGD